MNGGGHPEDMHATVPHPEPAAPAGDVPAGVDRFEWERIVRSIRWKGVIRVSSNLGKDGRPTRGAVSPAAVRAVAFVLAQHADPDGTNVRPGDALVAALAEVDIKQVKAVRAALLAHGLLTFVGSGARSRGEGNHYRLTRPADLLARFTYWGPMDLRTATEDIRRRNRRDRKRSDGPGTDTPVQGPTDPVQPAAAAGRTGSDGPAENRRTGSDGPAVQGPMDRYTNQDHPPTPTNTGADVRTAVTATRARDAAPEPDPPDGDSRPDPPPLRLIAGQGLTPHPHTTAQHALWPAPVPTPEVTTVNAEQARAHIRETLRGHRRASLSRYTRTSPPPVPRADAPPPAPPTRGYGLCIRCHLTGHPGVVAADPVNGDACPTHLHERNAAS